MTMIDVTKQGLETNASREDVARANEDNEWQKRLEDLAKIKFKGRSKALPPKEQKRVRISSSQQNAIRRK